MSGYQPYGSEKAIGASEPDHKEFFQFSFDRASSYSLPSGTAEVFDQIVSKVYAESEPGGQIALEFPILSDVILNSTAPFFRISRYSSCVEDQLINHAHQDICVVTALPVASCCGLEVLIDRDWVPVQCSANELVILAGEFAPLLTSNLVPADLHRVTGTGSSRLSISVFFNLDGQFVLPDGTSASQRILERLRDVSLHNRNN